MVLVRRSNAPQVDHGVDSAATTHNLGCNRRDGPVVESGLGGGRKTGPEVVVRSICARYEDSILASVKRASLNDEHSHCGRNGALASYRRWEICCLARIRPTVGVLCEAVCECKPCNAAAGDDEGVLGKKGLAINNGRMPGYLNRLGRSCRREGHKGEQSSKKRVPHLVPISQRYRGYPWGSQAGRPRAAAGRL